MTKYRLRFTRYDATARFARPNLRQLARALDLKSQSASGATSLCIENKILSGANRVRADAVRLMTEYESLARALTAEPLDYDRFISSAELDIASVEARLFEPLVHSRLEERRRLRELRRFKLDHNLERDASYAESILQPAANLALLVAAESAANALLLQTASAGGYVGGFLIAVIMSLVTVAMGALFAGLLGIRLMRRQGFCFRILGGSIFAGAMAFAGLWAFALARYRDAAMASAAGLHAPRGKRAAAAKAAGLFGPADGPVLGFSSLESLALVVLGLLVFVLAAMKGAGGRGGFTDAYWGYKPRDAAHRAADEAYQDEQEDYFEALEDVIEDAKEALNATAKGAAGRAAQARSFCDQALSVIPVAQAALQEWSDAQVELLRQAGFAAARAPANEAFTFNPAAEQDLRALRDAADASRAEDAAAANAARRALKQRLEDAQTRLAQRVADAETEADRRLAEELAILRGEGGLT